MAFGVFNDVARRRTRQLGSAVLGFLRVVFVALLSLAPGLDVRLQFLARAGQFLAGSFQLGLQLVAVKCTRSASGSAAIESLPLRANCRASKRIPAVSRASIKMRMVISCDDSMSGIYI